MKNKFITAIFFSFFLLLTTNVFAYQDYQSVDANKIWTLTFTGDVGFDDITKNAVVVKDSSGNKVNTTLKQGNDNKSILVYPPILGYTAGESYTININKQAHNKKGSKMKQDRIVHFSIKKSLTIGSIQNVTVVVNQNDSYTLPNTVQAIMSDGNTKDVSVVWDKQADTSKVGTFTYTGTVIGYSNAVKFNLTVKALPVTIASISDINATVNQNDSYSLPSTVQALMSDGNIHQVAVTWDKKVDTSQPGIFTFNGKVSGYSSNIKLSLIIKALPVTIKTIEYMNVIVNQNDKYTLPTTVTAVMSDGTSKSVSVIWDNQADTSKAGVFIYIGTVSGYSGKVGLGLTVKALPIPVTSVSLNKTTDILAVGGTDTLTATISPSNATNKNVTWTSSNTKVVTVSNGVINGVITAVSAGTATITATTADGNKVVTCIVTVGSDSIVTFKDKKLEEVVRDAVNKPIGDIYKSNVEKITYLFASHEGIKDISGIENLINLQRLSLDGNEISDISALKGLTNLQELVLENNQINDISSLSELTNLQKLYLENNQVNDINSLRGLTNLEYIDLSKNRINDISVLDKLINLQDISLESNQISDISALTGLTNLQIIDLSSNKVSDIIPLQNLSNLRELLLEKNQISDINSLKGLINLQWIYLDGNKISAADKELLKNALPKCYIQLTITPIVLSKTTDTLAVGKTDTLTVAVSSDTTDQGIKWTSSNPNVATVNNGVVTAVSVGTAIITATTADGNKTATCSVTVNPAVYPTSLTLNKTSSTLTVGEADTITAEVYPSNATNKTVMWTSSNPNVATVNNGVVKAVSVGATTITAATADGNKTATCSIIVNDQSGISISLDQTTAAVTAGYIHYLSAIVSASNSVDGTIKWTAETVRWTSSNPNVAKVYDDKILNYYNYHYYSSYVRGIKAGTAIITATTADGNKIATCVVTVTNEFPVTSISLNKTIDTLTVGGSDYLSTIISPSNATDKTVTWTSSNPNVAMVFNCNYFSYYDNCYYTGFVRGIKAGTAIITATTADGNKTATCSVTVNNPVITFKDVNLEKLIRQ